MEKITAVVLAAGAGKRMHSDVHKQYMMLAGRPVLFYALQAFAESAVTDIVVVVGAGEIDYCRKEIVEKYHIQKVCAVVEGGRERYHSVYEVSVGYGSGGAQPEYSCVGCAHGKMAESPGDCGGRREKGAGGLSAQRRM